MGIYSTVPHNFHNARLIIRLKQSGFIGMDEVPPLVGDQIRILLRGQDETAGKLYPLAIIVFARC
ncbi:MAG: hypothetical protein LBH57_00530 [Treponema sp.]|nr:hypothetical protein [Treponema sp.]